MDVGAFQKIPTLSYALCPLTKAGERPRRAPDPGCLGLSCLAGLVVWVGINPLLHDVCSQASHTGLRDLFRERQGADLLGLRAEAQGRGFLLGPAPDRAGCAIQNKPWAYGGPFWNQAK